MESVIPGSLAKVDNAALGVGGVAAVSALVGHLLAREILGKRSRLGRRSRSRPDTLPGLGLSLESVSVHVDG
jgi:hypothetical protein